MGGGGARGSKGGKCPDLVNCSLVLLTNRGKCAERCVVYIIYGPQFPRLNGKADRHGHPSPRLIDRADRPGLVSNGDVKKRDSLFCKTWEMLSSDAVSRYPANSYNVELFCINRGDQNVFQFEIIIIFLVSSFRFMWIHVLRVYGHY